MAWRFEANRFDHKSVQSATELQMKQLANLGFSAPSPSLYRRLHVYGVGAPKTGTQSLAFMFASNYRSAHEPLAQQFIAHIVAAAKEPDSGPQELAGFVRQVERDHAWEMNSSQLNVHVLDQLVAENPQAKFILTLRDCYSWLDSYINHHLAGSATEGRRQLRYLRHRPDLYPHRPQEQALADRGLFSLDGCLSFWAWHTQTVLKSVPSERLYVVRTSDLGNEILAMAAFLKVPEDTIDRNAAHSHRAAQKFHVLREVDRSFLEARVQEHCGGLMAVWFPEIRCMADASPRS